MNLDQLLAAVQAQKTVADSAVTLLARIHGELQAAINANDPAKIQAIADALGSNTQELSDAVVANTDAAAAAPASGDVTLDSQPGSTTTTPVADGAPAPVEPVTPPADPAASVPTAA